MRRSIRPSMGNGNMGNENEESEINRILSGEEEILPSSGFTVSAMDAVRREAAALPPIAFPWKRALPGMVVGGVALAVVLIALVRAIAQLDRTAASQLYVSLPSAMPALHHGSIGSAAAWTVVALLAALISVKVSMRLGSGTV
jgi:hypothetical protein